MKHSKNLIMNIGWRLSVKPYVWSIKNYNLNVFIIVKVPIKDKVDKCQMYLYRYVSWWNIIKNLIVNISIEVIGKNLCLIDKNYNLNVFIIVKVPIKR